MSHYTDHNPHMRLSFSEANILLENLRSQDKAGFVARLANLAQNTIDPFLLQTLVDLNEKIMELSEEEFTALREAVSKGEVLFPANFVLPKFTD